MYIIKSDLQEYSNKISGSRWYSLTLTNEKIAFHEIPTKVSTVTLLYHKIIEKQKLIPLGPNLKGTERLHIIKEEDEYFIELFCF